MLSQGSKALFCRCLDCFTPHLVSASSWSWSWPWTSYLAIVSCWNYLLQIAPKAPKEDNVRAHMIESAFLPHCMKCRRGLAMRILSVYLYVCLSVCPSITRVNCDKTVERSVQIYIPYERTFSLVFWEQEWLVGSDPFYLKFWVNRPPLEQNRWFWTDNRS